MTHTTVKNESKQVTGYYIKADGVTVGTAEKDDKGKFKFTPSWDGGSNISDMKTMRDLKTEVEKTIPSEFVKENKPTSPAKAEISEEQAQMEKDALAAAAANESEDIDLE